MNEQIDFDCKDYFINRELSWLEFNDRVLKEAKDRKNPLFERMKFLSIVSSNLDEFFMIRVAGLKDQVSVGFDKLDPAGLTPKKQLSHISERTHKMVKEQSRLLTQVIFPMLKKKGFYVVDSKQLTTKQQAFVEEYFIRNVYPVLTPMAVDSSRPFPLIQNKSLNIGILLREEENFTFATIQVPAGLTRIVEIPAQYNEFKSHEKNKTFIFLEEVIMMYVDRLFTGHETICAYPYRITRNADLTIEEEESEDLLLEIEKSLKKRKWGQAVRLEVARDMDERLVTLLKNELEIHNKDIFYIKGPLDLTFLMKVYNSKGYEEMKYVPYTPQIPQDFLGAEDIFATSAKKDVLLHHPYESFTPVVAFVQRAASDPDVLAIKQTLYRISGNSPIIKALEKAAENGKQVTVLVELKARFDEENNIQWAKRLEMAGCHVIYGLVGLKTQKLSIAKFT